MLRPEVVVLIQTWFRRFWPLASCLDFLIALSSGLTHYFNLKSVWFRTMAVYTSTWLSFRLKNHVVVFWLWSVYPWVYAEGIRKADWPVARTKFPARRNEGGRNRFSVTVKWLSQDELDDERRKYEESQYPTVGYITVRTNISVLTTGNIEHDQAPTLLGGLSWNGLGQHHQEVSFTASHCS